METINTYCITYQIYVPIVLKSGSLKLLEPSEPVQACNGIALTIELYMFRTGFTLRHQESSTIYTAIGICGTEIVKMGKITSVYTCRL